MDPPFFQAFPSFGRRKNRRKVNGPVPGPLRLTATFLFQSCLDVPLQLPFTLYFVPTKYALSFPHITSRKKNPGKFYKIRSDNPPVDIR